MGIIKIVQDCGETRDLVSDPDKGEISQDNFQSTKEKRDDNGFLDTFQTRDYHKVKQQPIKYTNAYQIPPLGGRITDVITNGPIVF